MGRGQGRLVELITAGAGSHLLTRARSEVAGSGLA